MANKWTREQLEKVDAVILDSALDWNITDQETADRINTEVRPELSPKFEAKDVRYRMRGIRASWNRRKSDELLVPEHDHIKAILADGIQYWQKHRDEKQATDALFKAMDIYNKMTGGYAPKKIELSDITVHDTVNIVRPDKPKDDEAD